MQVCTVIANPVVFYPSSGGLFNIHIAVVSIIDDTLEKKKTNVSENINNSGVKDGVIFFSPKRGKHLPVK